MSQTTIQIPMSNLLKSKAEARVQSMGFDSLEEFFSKYIIKSLAANEEIVILSKQAEKRYNKMTEDFEANKNVFVADGVDDFMKQLHED